MLPCTLDLGKEWILKGNSNHCCEIGVHNWKMLILLDLIQSTSESNKLLKITLAFHKKRLAAPKLRAPVAPLLAQEKSVHQIRGLIQFKPPGWAQEMAESSPRTSWLPHVPKNLKINVNPKEHTGVRVCLLQTLVYRQGTQGKDKNSLCDSGKSSSVLL